MKRTNSDGVLPTSKRRKTKESDNRANLSDNEESYYVESDLEMEDDPKPGKKREKSAAKENREELTHLPREACLRYYQLIDEEIVQFFESNADLTATSKKQLLAVGERLKKVVEQLLVPMSKAYRLEELTTKIQKAESECLKESQQLKSAEEEVEAHKAALIREKRELMQAEASLQETRQQRKALQEERMHPALKRPKTNDCPTRPRRQLLDPVPEPLPSTNDSEWDIIDEVEKLKSALVKRLLRLDELQHADKLSVLLNKIMRAKELITEIVRHIDPNSAVQLCMVPADQT